MILLRLLAAAVSVLPAEVAEAAGGVAGWVWYYVLPVRRRVALENVRRALGPTDAPRICRANFVHLMRILLDFLRAVGGGFRSLRGKIRVTGWDRVERARAAGRGVLIISGHVGSFDLIVPALGERGLKVHILTKHAKAQSLDRFWQQSRERLGVSMLPRRDAVWKILKALRRGEGIGIMIDQHQGGNAPIVQFFGRPASTTDAPAIFAERTGAPVLPVYLRRLSEGRHLLEVGEDLGFERISQDRAENLRHNVQRYSLDLESAIRRFPEQWFWVHRRWKAERRLQASAPAATGHQPSARAQ